VHERGLCRKASMLVGEKNLAALFLDAHVAQSGFHPVVCGGGQFFHRAPGGRGALVSNILFWGSAAALAACVMGHKEEYRDKNQQQNAEAASFHRLESPTRSPQSAFIHSTRTPCSQRGRMQRVPEYHCIVSIEGSTEGAN